jgi:hypothetical protein
LVHCRPLIKCWFHTTVTLRAYSLSR